MWELRNDGMLLVDPVRIITDAGLSKYDVFSVCLCFWFSLELSVAMIAVANSALSSIEDSKTREDQHLLLSK